MPAHCHTQIVNGKFYYYPILGVKISDRVNFPLLNWIYLLKYEKPIYDNMSFFTLVHFCNFTAPAINPDV